MTQPTWLWEKDPAIRAAYLELCLDVLQPGAPRQYAATYMAAAVDWALRERWRADRYRRALRALRARVVCQQALVSNQGQSPAWGHTTKGQQMTIWQSLIHWGLRAAQNEGQKLGMQAINDLSSQITQVLTQHTPDMKDHLVPVAQQLIQGLVAGAMTKTK